MSEKEAVSQFYFDYYFKECLDNLRDNNWILTEESKATLTALMAKEVWPDYAENKLKAHLLIIVYNVIKLKDMGLEDSFNNLRENNRLEIMLHLDNLQSSVEHLFHSETFTKLTDISRECLFQIYVLLVNIIHESISDEDADPLVLDVLERVVERLKSVVNFEREDEKNILDQCERVLSQSESCLHFPELNELWELIRALVLEACLFVEAPSDCICQLKDKMSGEKVIESRSKVSDLLEIIGKYKKSQDENMSSALREKCEHIKKQRQQHRDTSQKQSSFREQETMQEAGKPPTASQILNITDSSSGSEHVNMDSSQKYSMLSVVKPRYSLLEFGNSRKPPSHTKCALGKWLPTEEEEFIRETLVIGEGKWAEIRTALKCKRSNVQLKDKWRQISLSRILDVAKQYGLVYSGTQKQ
uniref:Myb-like domain-containing protein n=1 Tax=Arion vulgaris TaxID=1028688 RepID=A0A0B6ZEI6_9EUPU